MKLNIHIYERLDTTQDHVLIKNSLDRPLYVGGPDVTPENGFVVLTRQQRGVLVHDGQELWGCTEESAPQLLCVVRKGKR